MNKLANSAINSALQHIGLPLNPIIPTSIPRNRYNQVLNLAHRRLVSKGIAPRKPDVLPLLKSILRDKKYFSPARRRQAPRIVPVTIRQTITDAVTDVLSQRGFPPSQSATVVLPIYAEVISTVGERFQKARFPISRLAIASDLQKRRYIPIPARRPPYYANIPAGWREKVPAKPPSEFLSIPKGVFTGAKPIRAYPKVVRGAD